MAAHPTRGASLVGPQARCRKVDAAVEMKGDQGKMRLAARTAAKLYKEYVKMQGCVLRSA